MEYYSLLIIASIQTILEDEVHLICIKSPQSTPSYYYDSCTPGSIPGHPESHLEWPLLWTMSCMPNDQYCREASC